MNLQRIAALAAAVLVFGSPTQARQYIQLSAGYLETQIDVEAADLQGDLIEFDLDVKGANLNGVFGYDFGMARLEVEAGFNYQDIQDIDTNQQTFPFSSEIEAEAYTYTLMGNAIADVPIGPVDVFAGAGAGIAYTEVIVNFDLEGIDFGEEREDDTNFAWQILGGARYNINSQWSVHAQYRYLDIAKYDQQSIEIGAGYKF